MEIKLVMLLRAAWIGAILPILIASVPSVKLKKLRDLVSAFAKRGMTMQSSSKKFTVPQKFFCHFYVIGVLWTTALLVATWIYAYRMAPIGTEPFPFSSITSHLTGGSHSFSLLKSHSIKKEDKYQIWLSVFLLLLMEAQVLRRLLETIYVFKYSPSARMHIFAYLVGIFFYTAAPLSLCYTYVSEVFKHALVLLEEFIVKGKDRMQFTFGFWELVNPLIKVKWHAWVGATIFLWGWIHQRRCHAILGSLREKKEQADDYIIPHGDWFEYVSCAHYLAEIVIYFGILIASGGLDVMVWLLFGFVVVNLAFAASETHRWYLRKFDNYPKDRFAIIPFVY
ncbi:hypothetical protein M9H77_13607 [Catharanthus roseus]|uniref:Uncharacterized protein n=1 Tax=Catharanthus roseus TaxID=4058 RepID=A0ACC0BKW7_CATRO|nr:hypothetical protein M9H77_13607 [Catharanthus roseus]